MASSRNSGRSTVAAPKRYGSEQPRIFTPPLRRLTPKTSLGFSAVEFAEDVLEMSLFPWQRWLLIHALETLPDGSFRFRNVVVLVARQNGKSTLSIVLSQWSMYVLGRPLPDRIPLRLVNLLGQELVAGELRVAASSVREVAGDGEPDLHVDLIVLQRLVLRVVRIELTERIGGSTRDARALVVEVSDVGAAEAVTR